MVNHPKDNLGFFDGSIGALDTNFFDGVGGFAKSGGVDETEGDAVDVDGVFDGVASGAMNVADDGTVVA